MDIKYIASIDKIQYNVLNNFDFYDKKVYLPKERHAPNLASNKMACDIFQGKSGAYDLIINKK